jgi:DNA-binding transcriptional regulator YiaG
LIKRNDFLCVNSMSDLALAVPQAADEPLVHRLDGRHAWRLPSAADVRAIRDKLELSQSQFANRFGLSVRAVREWEQGRRQPEAPARILLLLIASRPNVVDEVLAAAMLAAAA